MQHPDQSSAFLAPVPAEKDQLILRERLTLLQPSVEMIATDRTGVSTRPVGDQDERVAPLAKQPEQSADEAVLTERGLTMSLRQRWSSVVSRVVDVCSRMHLPSCCC
jgi:hypothetical protein